MDSITKRCSHCKQYLPATIEYFPPDKRKRDGFYTQCRVCHNKSVKRYYEANREKVLKTIVQWQHNNPDKVREIQRKHRRTHPDYYKKKYDRYRRKYPEKHNARGRKWKRLNHKKLREGERRYQHANNERFRIKNQKRRARIQALPSTLTLTEWEQIKSEWGYTCAYCGKAWWEIKGKFHQDHVTPVAQGGGYTKENIVPACADCNLKKSDRTPEQAGMKLRDRHC